MASQFSIMLDEHSEALVFFKGFYRCTICFVKCAIEALRNFTRASSFLKAPGWEKCSK